MSQGHVVIGPEFFQKELKDYADWKWAFVREAAQNGIDAPGATRVWFDLYYSAESGSTLVSFGNDGSPMSREELLTKFLSLGSSGKNFAGTTGGFGKAKVILCFAHEGYTIETGALKCTGAGGLYDIADVEPIEGTKTTVIIKGDHVNELRYAVQRFASMLQWRGELSLRLNGADYELPDRLKKGSHRRNFPFGEVFTNRSFSNKLVVRINGIPMFSTWCALDRCVVLELGGTSADCLTSNRDHLLGKYDAVLQQFLTDLAVNSKTALRDPVTTYQYYHGTSLEYSLSHSAKWGSLVSGAVHDHIVETMRPELEEARKAAAWDENLRDVIEVTSKDDLSEAEVESITQDAVAVLDDTSMFIEPDTLKVMLKAVDDLAMAGGCEVIETGYDTDEKATRFRRSTVHHEFIVKNDTQLSVPDYYTPVDPSAYTRKLISQWVKCLIELFDLFETTDQFAVGFVFCPEKEDRDAEFEEHGEYGNLFLLNPCKIVEQNSSRSRSLSKRRLLTDHDDLLATAVHEFAHYVGRKNGPTPFCGHDEDYANALTEMFVKVMKNRKRFNKCFR